MSENAKKVVIDSHIISYILLEIKKLPRTGF